MKEKYPNFLVQFIKLFLLTNIIFVIPVHVDLANCKFSFLLTDVGTLRACNI